MGLWAFSRLNLHITESEFWALTLREWSALVDQFRKADEQAEYRAALICSVLANCYRDSRHKPEPFEPGDFMRRIQNGEP